MPERLQKLIAQADPQQDRIEAGRLPYDGQGWLGLTTEGAFAHTLLPRRLARTYWLKVKGKLPHDEISPLERMARRRLPEFPFRLIKPGANAWYEVTRVEPRPDWLRTALFPSGHPVGRVKRLAIGSLRPLGLFLGRSREPTKPEVERLPRETVLPSLKPRLRQGLAG